MTPEQLQSLLTPFVEFPNASPLPHRLYSHLAVYLDLLLRWNARTNLTAIRDPEEMVTRHFGEGLFTALQLKPYLAAGATLLDVGSGAGFPGLPIQLAIPELQVTLAESQIKKAAFLREVIRALNLRTEVWAERAEALPTARRFSVVTLRAVDRMQVAQRVASSRVAEGGILAELIAESAPSPAALKPLTPPIAIPCGQHRFLRMWLRVGGA